jgi:hypothetical protein
VRRLRLVSSPQKGVPARPPRVAAADGALLPRGDAARPQAAAAAAACGCASFGARRGAALGRGSSELRDARLPARQASGGSRRTRARLGTRVSRAPLHRLVPLPSTLQASPPWRWPRPPTPRRTRRRSRVSVRDEVAAGARGAVPSCAHKAPDRPRAAAGAMSAAGAALWRLPQAQAQVAVRTRRARVRHPCAAPPFTRAAAPPRRGHARRGQRRQLVAPAALGWRRRCPR